jgi:hypothetical protein
MEELTHKVQYRRKTGNCDLGWHTMAAFDCEIIADQYCRQCMEGREDFEYRVTPVTLNDMTWGSYAAAS